MGRILHASATTTEAIRRANQNREERGGSVRLSLFRAFLKWISALIMLQPELATAG